jgi:predicted  nucleic acid-binding Zn-ribbon protein
VGQTEIKELFRVLREIQSLLNQNFSLDDEIKKQLDRLKHLNSTYQSKQEELANLELEQKLLLQQVQELEKTSDKESKQIEKLSRDIYELKNSQDVESAKKQLAEITHSKIVHEADYFSKLDLSEINQREIPKLTKYLEGFFSSITELQGELRELEISHYAKMKQNMDLTKTHLDLFPPSLAQGIGQLIKKNPHKVCASVAGNKCGSCHMQLSAPQAQAAAKMLDIAKCSHCGLILMPEGAFS